MKNMNHLVSLLQEGYTTIGVIFAAAQPWELDSAKDEYREPQVRGANGVPARAQVYTYKCHFECILGDLVILPPHQNNKLPSVGTIVRIDDEPELNFESGIEYKWAVQRVDMDAYDKIQEKERALIKVLRDGERKKQRQELLESYQLSLPSDPESVKIIADARAIGRTPKE